MAVKPAFVREVERKLQSLIGKSFSKVDIHYDPLLGMKITVERDPAKYVESIAFSIIEQTRPDRKRVQPEPNGKRTFPDISCLFFNSFRYDFEVKSWLSAYRNWHAASVNQLFNSLELESSKYFDAWFIDFKLKETNETYQIEDVKIGKIWDFASGLSKSGRTPGFTSSYSVDPVTFVENITTSYSGDKALLYSKAVNILLSKNLIDSSSVTK